MEAVSLTSTFLPSLSRSRGTRPRKSAAAAVRVEAALTRRNSYGSGRQVDEGMIVLRKRIHEMKVIERNYQPPAEWMEWEKQIYANYDDLICRSLAVVQSLLLESRPSVAFAVLALIGASVPASVVLIALRIASAAAGHS
ncbi:hypothetical protein V2J09_012615 [Rumex salicifolius]